MNYSHKCASLSCAVVFKPQSDPSKSNQPHLPVQLLKAEGEWEKVVWKIFIFKSHLALYYVFKPAIVEFLLENKL